MAVTSEVGIYNLALNAVGERANISLPTETSRRAEVCNLWYETVRDQVFEGAPWPEATTTNYVALQSEREEDTWLHGEPRRGYAYAYALPSDYLRAQYLDDFSQFSIEEYEDQRWLLTNTENAILTYTKRLTNISLWSAGLRMAVAYGLAAHICMPLTGKPSRARVLADKANELLMTARVNAANMDTQLYEHIPDWIAARGYNQSTHTRYFYPTGSLLSVN